MGRHSDWHDGTVLYLSNTSRTAGAAAETAADKKTAKYSPLVQTYVLFQLPWKSWERPSTATELDSLATWEGALHKSQMISASLPSVPAPVSSYSALQCGRHPGHLCPHNRWGRILGRSSLFVFNFCFNPRDFYYTEGKIIIIIITTTIFIVTIFVH